MILLLVSFVAGLLTALAPCVLPLLPVIVGRSISGGKSLKRALTVTASLTISVTFFTLLIKASTSLIGIPQDVWKWLSGGIILGFGVITLFPSFWEKLPLLSRFSLESNKILSSGYRKQSLFGDIIVGAALGPVFSTCSPTYFLVLATVLPERTILGFLYLIVYSIGLSLALLLIALVGQRVLHVARIAADPHGAFKKVLGILFLVVGVMIISGLDKQAQIRLLDAGFFDVTKIEQRLLNLVPDNQSMSTNGQGGNGDVQEAFRLEKQQRYPLAKEISTPDGFVNTDGKPVTLESLRGKVVLLDIWTYSCINCQRTIPHLNALYKTYRDDGLEIIGLHTPEFAFEKILSNVEKATKQLGIKYPVVLDNDYSTWNAYGNRYWPRKYLIDIDGYIVYDHIGEGGYVETEQAIQRALNERKARMGGGRDLSGSALSEATDVDSHVSRTPEIYFGAERNLYLGNGVRGVLGQQVFQSPVSQEPDLLYLKGEWNIAGEYAESVNQASILLRYQAKNVYFVGGSPDGAEISIYKDDVFVKTISIKDETLYSLIEDASNEGHILRIEVKKGTLQAFTFTFG